MTDALEAAFERPFLELLPSFARIVDALSDLAAGDDRARLLLVQLNDLMDQCAASLDLDWTVEPGSHDEQSRKWSAILAKKECAPPPPSRHSPFALPPAHRAVPFVEPTPPRC